MRSFKSSESDVSHKVSEHGMMGPKTKGLRLTFMVQAERAQ